MSARKSLAVMPAHMTATTRSEFKMGIIPSATEGALKPLLEWLQYTQIALVWLPHMHYMHKTHKCSYCSSTVSHQKFEYETKHSLQVSKQLSRLKQAVSFRNTITAQNVLLLFFFCFFFFVWCNWIKCYMNNLYSYSFSNKHFLLITENILEQFHTMYYHAVSVHTGHHWPVKNKQTKKHPSSENKQLI